MLSMNHIIKEGQMRKIFPFFVFILLAQSLPLSSQPQADDSFIAGGIKINPGIRFEYFSRKITWDEKKNTSNLNSYFVALNTEFEIQKDFSITAIIGYSRTKFESLIFRQLPFSVELVDGNTDGFVFGAEFEKSMFFLNDFEIGVVGHFFYNLGREKKWALSVLSVEGSVTGKPSWMNASIGPILKYSGFDYFYPYLCLCYNRFWGNFKMDQSVQDLKGTEDKDITGKSVFDVMIGNIYELSDHLSLKTEAHLLPYKGGQNFGFMVGVILSF